MATANPGQNRKDFLKQLVMKSGELKHISKMIDSFIECMSFISNNKEIKKVVSVVTDFEEKVESLQLFFDNLNSGLYDLANDEDTLPCASQDPNSVMETETFKEKKELLCRVIMRTKVYVENPCFMESALTIADNETTYIEASKFLRKQFRTVHTILCKYFPEEENSFPSAGEGLTCPELVTFEKMCMPLIHILDYFAGKLKHKCVANSDYHNGVYEMFKAVNAKYECLFAKTCWEDKGWQEMMAKAEKK